MKKNIYYENLHSIFMKVADNNNNAVWDEIIKTLHKLEPDRGNKELFSQIVECFERLELEFKNDKISLFFLSFLINITKDIKYFEKFIYLCLHGSNIPANTKFYIYNYCRVLIQDNFYFQEQRCLDYLSSLLNQCIDMMKKYLREDMSKLAEIRQGSGALLIISDFGEYPFGTIKHLLDVCKFLSQKKEKIYIFITHEESFEYGRINLYPFSACKLDTVENTVQGISMLTTLNKNMEIHEFNTKNSYVSEVKLALSKILEIKPKQIINFSDKNVFAQLLKLNLEIKDIKDFTIIEPPETQKDIRKLASAAQKAIGEKNFDMAKNSLYEAYEASMNNDIKVGICIKLVDLYLNMGMKEQALKIAKGLPILKEADYVYNCLAQIYEDLTENRNAIFLYEKIKSANKDDYICNLKLFRLYIVEKMYEKAAEQNDYFKDRSDANIEFYRYLLYFGSFMENEAFIAAEASLRLSREARDIKRYMEMMTNTIGCLQYYDVYDDDKYIQILNEMYSMKKPENENIFFKRKLKENSIRLGFLSGETAHHPVGFFITSLFKKRCTNGRFEYFYYDLSKLDKIDERTDIIKNEADVYREMGGLSDKKISDAILSDNIDILIDLNGVSGTQKINILVERLAPIQITWIGFPGSLPIKNMDYNIVDQYTDPVNISEKFYTEKLIYLPKTFLCYSIKTNAEIIEPPCIKNGFITFGSFNNPNKYSNAILKLWARLLDEIKDAKLIIRANNVKSKFIKKKLVEKFIANGIDMERTEILPPTYVDDYYLGYNDVDIILDTYPFNGATTTCDAFLMGTPLISLYGNRHVSRVGLSMLSNVGLSDLAVSNADDYIKKAVELSADIDRLKFLSKNLRDISLSSPLMNYKEFQRDFEKVIYEVYRRGDVINGASN